MFGRGMWLPATHTMHEFWQCATRTFAANAEQNGAHNDDHSKGKRQYKASANAELAELIDERRRVVEHHTVACRRIEQNLNPLLVGVLLMIIVNPFARTRRNTRIVVVISPLHGFFFG